VILELDGLSHRYGDERALEGVSFGVAHGELVAILGPSGCGKTTILQAIAGHVSPTAGCVRLRGKDVTATPPEARRVGLVFQRSTLYPHMAIDENIRYGLTARGIGGDEQDEIVAEYLELVDIVDQRGARPSELSGGQERRAELARALAPQPDILLLDEPLSALDRALRDRLREEIARIQRETGVTTLFVTHDQEEAMALADRIVVVNDGRVEAIGEPRALYE
jgi:ABC-type Fe3+/spermidine/putrescine transport system ATPase subunit